MGIINDTYRAVKVFLKDGSSVYGILLQDIDNITTTIENWMFVPNINAKRYAETHDMALVQTLPNELVEAIDPNLK